MRALFWPGPRGPVSFRLARWARGWNSVPADAYGNESSASEDELRPAAQETSVPPNQQHLTLPQLISSPTPLESRLLNHDQYP